MRDDAFHQRAHGAVARAILEVVELTEEIHRRMSRNGGHLAQAVERWAVTDRALNRFSAASGRHEFLAFGQAALRNIGNESGMRIAALRPGNILRQLYDAIANGLVTGAGQRHAHQMLVDESLWHAIGF